MAKFYGNIGFGVQAETAPGVWTDVMVERPYYGDVTRNARRLESGSAVNGEITLNNMLSIVADPYANETYFAIRYAIWMGAYWKVTNVEVQRPRLILTLGGVYNGQKA
jgi:hypothetical protein